MRDDETVDDRVVDVRVSVIIISSSRQATTAPALLSFSFFSSSPSSFTAILSNKMRRYRAARARAHLSRNFLTRFSEISHSLFKSFKVARILRATC